MWMYVLCPDISVSSADCTITPLILEHIFVWSHAFGENLTLPSCRQSLPFSIFYYTQYPFQLGEQRQCGLRSLPDTSRHDWQWKIPTSNPRACDLVYNTVSTWPISPIQHIHNRYHFSAGFTVCIQYRLWDWNYLDGRDFCPSSAPLTADINVWGNSSKIFVYGIWCNEHTDYWREWCLLSSIFLFV